MHGNDFLVLVGSVRPVRRAPTIAAWVAQLGADLTGRGFQLVDLKELQLGLDDEPDIPAKGVYACATTQAWSEQVQGAAGVVIVTPQYNWGYPAALKNAIDHLYAEWRGKPVLIVSYGGHGGDRCAAQLRQVLGGMNARPTDAAPGLQLARAQIEADDGQVDPPRDFAAARETLETGLRELVALADAAAMEAQPG